MTHPYENLPPRAFWRPAVAETPALQIVDLWEPKHRVGRQHRVATMGSCFAQHFARTLVEENYNWVDAEAAPKMFSDEVKKKYNYGIFSARTGNIYTAAALRQWIAWALAKETPPDEIWEQDGRYVDPFRPNIEPGGFATPGEMLASREVTLAAFREIVQLSDHFVFTMGLTEGWINQSNGNVYPMCPGTIAGRFDASQHRFKNYEFSEILEDMKSVVSLIKSVNSNVRILLTVSPIPLTATASGQHVLPATVYSKSVLRAVAGQLAQTDPSIDYFPSYELITGAPFRAIFFAPNMRSVAPEGVRFVLDAFFGCLQRKFGAEKIEAEEAPDVDGAELRTPMAPEDSQADEGDDLVCEEQMLEAFSGARVRQ